MKIETPTLDDNKDSIKVILSQLPEDSIKERSFDLNRLYEIAMIRESSHPQFDGMSYMKYNETNEMTDISYLAPKVNKMDSRITSGITHEKDSSLVSFMMNMKFEGTVRVFKGDKEEFDLGVALTNWVRKSREEEDYDRKRPIFYRNLVSQGTSFALEEYVEHYRPKKVINGEVDYTRLDQVKWTEAGVEKIYDGCESTLIDGKKVFLENIREPDIQKQPGVYTVEYVPREICEAVWGKNERWKMVPKTYADLAPSLTQGSIYSDWIFSPIDLDKCSVIKVFRPMEQRFQVYINSVPMLAPKFPLKAVSPSGLINIAKGDADLMNMFAYSKSEPAKTKIDQAVFDKVLQNMLVKFQQSAFTPRGNLSGKVYDQSILMGGRMISDLDPKDLPPLIENPGITNADFSFYNLLKEQIDSKTISAMMEGNPTQGDITLGQYLDMQKKQALKLGGKIDGVVNWERQMLRLRTMNLIANGARKTGKKVEGEKGLKNEYKDVPVSSQLSNGVQGLNVLRFDEQNYRSSEDVFNENNQYAEQNGMEAEITYLNPVLLKQLIDDPEYYICYEVVPVDKGNDKLAQMMFVKMITDAANLFGIDSLQVENLKKRYASKMGEKFDDLFLGAQELQMKQMEMQQAAQAEGAKPGAVASPIQAPSMKDAMYA